MQEPVSLVRGRGGNPPSERETKLEKELQALEQEKEQKIAAMRKFLETGLATEKGQIMKDCLASIAEGSRYETLRLFCRLHVGDPEELKELEQEDPDMLRFEKLHQLTWLRIICPVIEVLEKEHNKQEELANLQKEHK